MNAQFTKQSRHILNWFRIKMSIRYEIKVEIKKYVRNIRNEKIKEYALNGYYKANLGFIFLSSIP